MGAGVAVQLAKKVGCSVGNQRLLDEIRGAVDHAEQLGHPFHLIQVANDGFYIRQASQASLPCPLVTLLAP